MLMIISNIPVSWEGYLRLNLMPNTGVDFFLSGALTTIPFQQNINICVMYIFVGSAAPTGV